MAGTGRVPPSRVTAALARAPTRAPAGSSSGSPSASSRCSAWSRPGRSNREIAGELFISPKTASVHVSNILGKLGVASRGEAAAKAHSLRLFDPTSTA